jgi:general secretion pathway protein L
MKSATTSWRQRVRDAANRAGLQRFWSWWIGELAPVLPWRATIQRRFARPVIELVDGEAVFWRSEIRDGAARLVATDKVFLAGDPAAVLAAGRAAVSRLAANGARIVAPKVVVALSSRDVLRKELALPAAAEENLAQTLAYDLDRHTPFRPEQLYFDATVVKRDPAKKMLQIDWVAALRTVVDGARRQIEEWGAIPVAVVPGPPKPGAARLNLLPDVARPRPLQWQRPQVWAPLALVAVLLVAALFIPLLQKRDYAIALGVQTDEAGRRALAADALRQQLEHLQGDYNYALTKKYAYPSTVQVLDDITRILPDDTWLTQFEIKTSGKGKEMRRDVYLRGESANAGKLISLLEDSGQFEQTAPRSPTTKIQGAPGEVFDLGAHVKPVALPAARAVAAPSAPAVAAPGAPAVAPPRRAAAPAPVPAAPVAKTTAPIAPPEAVPAPQRPRAQPSEVPAPPAPAAEQPTPAPAPAPAPEGEPDVQPGPRSS